MASDGGGTVVAVWERLTAGPIEAAHIRPDGSWSRPVAISGDDARDPAVAVSPGGATTAVWQQPVDRDTTRIFAADRGADGRWGAPVPVSPAGAHAREPQIATTGDGTTIVVWRRQSTGDRTVIEVVERAPRSPWGTPRRVSTTTARALRPRLAATVPGAAAVVWTQQIDGDERVAAATRTASGQWSSEVVLTGAGQQGREPDVAVAPTGDATAVWVGEDTQSVGAFSASFTPSMGWSPALALARADARPRELARPGRAETGADVAALVDGRFVAGWELTTDDTSRAVVAARAPGGPWTAPRELSRAHAVAGGVQVANAGAGIVAAAWEERDGGLIRARAAFVSADGDVRQCHDLTAAVTESGSVRVATGTSAAAVFVDLNRNRVQAAVVR